VVVGHLAYERVELAVGVAVDQVRGTAGKEHVAAVGRQRVAGRLAICGFLAVVQVDADVAIRREDVHPYAVSEVGRDRHPAAVSGYPDQLVYPRRDSRGR
jgi:hypothetical protein